MNYSVYVFGIAGNKICAFLSVSVDYLRRKILNRFYRIILSYHAQVCRVKVYADSL